MLTIAGLFAGYGGGDVLRGVDLTVAEGSITCVVGPNGAGKSTLLKVVSGLIRPRLGTITFRDAPIGELRPGGCSRPASSRSCSRGTCSLI